MTALGMNFDHERLLFRNDIGYRLVLLAITRRAAEIRTQQNRGVS